MDPSKKTVEVTEQVATSEETKTVVKNVGTWFQRDFSISQGPICHRLLSISD